MKNIRIPILIVVAALFFQMCMLKSNEKKYEVPHEAESIIKTYEQELEAKSIVMYIDVVENTDSINVNVSVAEPQNIPGLDAEMKNLSKEMAYKLYACFDNDALIKEIAVSYIFERGLGENYAIPKHTFTSEDFME